MTHVIPQLADVSHDPLSEVDPSWHKAKQAFNSNVNTDIHSRLPCH